MEALAVEGDDAGGFLATMLKGMQTERGDRGGVGMAEDAEYAALFAQPVSVKVEMSRFCHGLGPRSSQCMILLASSNCCIPVRLELL